jgi:predicted anti-sigma-YlaC factor YlaD
MRCAKAKLLWIERDLGQGAPVSSSALEAHIARCAACSVWVVRAGEVGRDLRALRTEPPYTVDVTARVLREVAAWPRPRSEEPRAVILAWSSLGALTTAAGLLLGLASRLPAGARAAHGAWLALAGFGSALAGLAESILAPALHLLVRGAAALPSSAPGSAAVIQLAIAVAALAMTSTVVIVVGRDFRRPGVVREEPRP